ncbi:MAG TPA: class I SAM-dependent methyltransferase [Stellaceae bacterium]|nr:class I SAM-dependent methyltransferase [Stellaceae bacterium]
MAETHHPFWEDYPRIRGEHLRDARLYAERTDLIRALPVRPRGRIAEIGVWRANFSKVLVTELQPRQFFAFDIFTGHLATDWNGLSGTQLFDGLTHRAFYEREMRPYGDIVTVVEGPNAAVLPNYADHSFDLVYVDAAHDYESVKIDAALAVKMVAESGLLVFNDYTVLDPGDGSRYGVVPVVNDLVVNHGWKIIGFALDIAMYCDIALQR